MATGFIFGGNTGETPESLKRKRSVAEALLARSSRLPQNVGEGIASIGNALLYRSLMNEADQKERMGLESASLDFAPMASPGMANPMPSGMPAPAGAGTASTPGAGDLTDNAVYNGFMDTVKTGVTNPNALAAIAATGNAESGFDPANATRTWSDPSESGQPGTAGGVMSWRGPRYEALAKFGNGDLSPETQAKFFLQENPQLIAQLNNAKTVEEAQQLMNNAWAFAGYDRPGGEAARRLQLANSYLPRFQAGGEVAAATPEAAIEAIAPTSAGAQPQQPEVSLSDEVAAYEQTPEYAARYPGRAPPITQQNFDERWGAPKQPAVAQALLGPQTAYQAPAGPSATAQALMAPPPSPEPPLPVETAQAAPAGRKNAGVIDAILSPPPQAGPGSDYFPAAPNHPGQRGPSPAQAMRVLTNPYSSPEQRAIAQDILERQQRQADPAYQLDMETKRAQLEALKAKPGKNWQKLDDNTLFNPETGETKSVGTTPGNGAFRFGGTSVEAQALNGLMDSGALTPDQAQQLAAGKTVSGPNGELLFMTPQGVFGQSPTGGPAQPVKGPQDGIDIFGAPPQGPATPVPQPPEATAPRQSGMIPLTAPRVTIDESKAAGFADRMTEAEDALTKFGSAGANTWAQFVTDNPYIWDQVENWMVDSDFQQFAQARRNFINSQLRRESGAVISPEEFSNANKQYFPLPGDSEEVLKRKAENRQTVINAMIRDAGPTYGKGKKPPADMADVPDFSKMSDEELRRITGGN